MKALLLIMLFSSAFLSSSTVAPAQAVPQANVQLLSDNPHLKPGSDLVFTVKLDKPLPEGAHFDVRLSPTGLNQELPVSSGEPTNKERTEFKLQTKLPETAWAGPWHIAVVWLFLPGSSWTQSQISTNDMKFVVDGAPKSLPTNGTATIVGK
jgi:hypothetical protein